MAMHPATSSVLNGMHAAIGREAQPGISRKDRLHRLVTELPERLQICTLFGTWHHVKTSELMDTVLDTVEWFLSTIVLTPGLSP